MELVESLERPYLTVPVDPRRRTGWWAVEVFPHPALVELGSLERTLADAHVCAYVALWWWWHGLADAGRRRRRGRRHPRAHATG